MRNVIATFLALLLSVFLLVAGNGLHGTLISVRAQIEGFSLTEVGLVGAAYFVGFLLGCLWAGKLIRRVGHIRTFAILAAIAAQVALFQSFFIAPIPWFLFRAISGFCFAGLAMIIESWLNENASNENRGKVISIYRIVDLSGTFCGQVIFALSVPSGFVLFAVVTSLVTLSLIPVSATTSKLPREAGKMSINLPKVWGKAQTAVTTCLVIGLANSSFWTLAPLYALEMGGAQIWVSIFMALMVLGGGLAVWPMGAWSDRVDRRVPIFVCTIIVISVSAFAVVAPLDPKPLLVLTGFFYGVGALSQYGLAIAHANDAADEDEFIEVSSTLLFVFAIGSILGPFLASVFMKAYGAAAMFVFIGGIHLISASHNLIRIGINRLDVGVKEKFIPVPRTTQEIFDVDPRGEDS